MINYVSSRIAPKSEEPQMETPNTNKRTKKSLSEIMRDLWFLVSHAFFAWLVIAGYYGHPLAQAIILLWLFVIVMRAYAPTVIKELWQEIRYKD